MKFTSETNDFIKNSSWSLIGSIISKGLMFLAWIIVANILGQTANGEIGVLRTTVSLFVALIGNGFGLTLTKYLARSKESDKRFIGKILGMSITSSIFFGLIITGIYFFLTPWISVVIFEAPHLLEVFQLNSILLFLSVLNGVLLGALQGFSMFKEVSIINIFYGIILFVGVTYGAYQLDIFLVFTGFIISILSSVILSVVFFIKRMNKENLSIDFNFYSQMKILKQFTIPAILTGLMVIPFKWILETMLVRSPDGYDELGLFSAIFLFHTLLLMLINAVNAPFLISLSQSSKTDGMEVMNLALPWAVGLFLIAPVLIFPEILGLFLNDSYVEDENFKWTTVLICIFTVFVLFKNGMGRVMVINNLMWFSFFSNALWGITLISIFALTSTKNSVTFSMAYVAAYFVNIVFVVPYYLNKNIIPKKVILSKNALAIWIVFSICILMAILSSKLSVLTRLLVLVLVLSAYIYSFLKIYKNG